MYDDESGGHHPAHFDDVLHKQHRVLLILGHWGHETVWLCRDGSESGHRFIALKIIIAETSTYDCRESRFSSFLEVKQMDKELAAEFFHLLLDKFEVGGPNCVNYIFAFPVLGPRLSDIPEIQDARKRRKTLRNLCFQEMHGIAILYDHGIYHGGVLGP